MISQKGLRYGLSHQRRGGFVTLLAIALMAMVALALAALTTRTNTAMHQARVEEDEAQVDQLMLAGVELARDNAAKRDIVLPGELTALGAKLRVVTREKWVEIEAAVGNSRRQETLSPNF